MMPIGLRWSTPGSPRRSTRPLSIWPSTKFIVRAMGGAGTLPSWISRSCSNPSRPLIVAGSASRSEEHTSELQSLMRISYAVFCLKKKTKTYTTKQYKHKKLKHNESNHKIDLQTLTSKH